jgi:superfamily II DNA or RNA helicase
MKLTILSPIKAYLSDYSDDELFSLKKALTYTNTSVSHLIKRHYNQSFWRSRNPDTWQSHLEGLQKELKKTLIFDDGDGKPYIRPGSIPYLTGFYSQLENWIQYPKTKSIPWKNPLPFTLYPYQEESWTKLLQEKHGNVEICTGGGKTATMFKLIAELGVQSVIVTPSSSIFNEILEKAEHHFGKKLVGGFGDGKKKIDKKITVAISKSLSMLKPETKEYEFFNKTEAFLGDECFPYRTRIITDRGYKEIGSIHKEIQEGKEVRVLSFNEILKKYEFKKVTNSWKREQQEKLVYFCCSTFEFRCTENHPILTNLGWKKAVEVQEGDLLIGYRGIGRKGSVNKIMNSDQEQIFIGSYLGDGSVSTHANGVRCRIIHGMKQEEYLLWKASVFGVNNIERLKKNGYSQKPAVRFNTKLLSPIIPMTFSSPKLDGIEEVLNRLDARGVAIWFMDDGNMEQSSAKLHTESFPLEIQQKFVNFFVKKFNIDATIRKDQGKDWLYYNLNFNAENSQKLIELISNYIHPSMKYKVRGNECGSYIWDGQYLDYGYSKVTRKSFFEPKKASNYKRNRSLWDLYDLEVEDNHNFVVGNTSGIVAHNCHTLPAESLEEICHGVLSNAPYRFFFSGTAIRNDGSGPLLQSIIGKTVHSLTTEDAVKQGFISPHEYRIISMESSNPSFDSSDALALKREHFLKNRNIAHFIARLANGMALAQGKQTLVLCEELSQLSMLAPLLKVPYALAHSEKRAGRLTELGLEKVDVAESIEKFNKNEAKVLIGTSCISTGTNIYPCHSTVNWVGGSSPIKTKQGAIGRSVRFGHSNPWASKCVQKDTAIIYDFDVPNHAMERHLEARLSCYKESGTEIRHVKLKS